MTAINADNNKNGIFSSVFTICLQEIVWINSSDNVSFVFIAYLRLDTGLIQSAPKVPGRHNNSANMHCRRKCSDKTCGIFPWLSDYDHEFDLELDLQGYLKV